MPSDPDGEIYEPRFTYHGFQYVQIEGLKYTPTSADKGNRAVVGYAQSQDI
ncbi:MAG: family 78 glycoside hydrolase catalytic domain [Spirosomataceae bacterium]